MGDQVKPWQRDVFEDSGNKAEYHWVIFAENAVPEPQLSVSLDGLPEGADPDVYEAKLIDDPIWIAGFFAGPMRQVIRAQAPGLDPDRIAKAPHAFYLRADVRDLADLSTLQSGLAICHGFARTGVALAVLDLMCMRFWEPAAVAKLAPNRPFDIREHVWITTEIDTGLSHTRGMRKFARPDIAVVGNSNNQGGVAGLLNEVANRCAMGKRYGARTLVRFPGLTVPDFGFAEHAPTSPWGETLRNSVLEIRDFDPATGIAATAERVLRAAAAPENAVRPLH